MKNIMKLTECSKYFPSSSGGQFFRFTQEIGKQCHRKGKYVFPQIRQRRK